MPSCSVDDSHFFPGAMSFFLGSTLLKLAAALPDLG
jgi:hypothetical protein